ncbi:MAG: hypothetical protein IJ899_15480 [Blautia sp.]|nr:hypothetical protein [Blautia sp.]
MNDKEKIFGIMSKSGTVSLVVGIISVVTGIVTGILMIVHGAMLLKGKNDIIF